MTITAPTMDELLLIEKQAELLAASNIVPRDYVGKPANIIAAALMGRAFGWDPTASMRNFSIIQNVATMKPEAMLGLIRQAGHSVTTEELPDGSGVKATGVRCDNGDTATAVFTLKDAELAGLLRSGPWKQYPLDMCKWRAVSRLARGLFGDVVLGAGYVPEEIAMVRGIEDDMRISSTGELVARDWVAEADELDDLDALRDLYVQAKRAGAPSQTLSAIEARATVLAQPEQQDSTEPADTQPADTQPADTEPTNSTQETSDAADDALQGLITAAQAIGSSEADLLKGARQLFKVKSLANLTDEQIAQLSSSIAARTKATSAA